MWPGTTPMYVIPRSSNSWPGWAKLTTDLRRRRESSSAVSPKIGRRRTRLSYAVRLVRQAVDSLIGERYFESAPTVGLIDISLSLRTISISRLTLADVVERLEAEPAHQRRIPDDDRDALQAVAEVARRREALGDREARARMAAVEHVVLRLGAAREATDAVQLAQRAELLVAARQQLVGIGLVAGVPDDPVARRVEQPMQRDASARRRRATSRGGRRSGDRLDDRLADLGGEGDQLVLGEPAQVGRSARASEGWPEVLVGDRGVRVTAALASV